jgi:hypothetical protein
MREQEGIDVISTFCVPLKPVAKIFSHIPLRRLAVIRTVPNVYVNQQGSSAA